MLVSLSLLAGAGLIGTFDLPATDVFLEATRPDFQKIPVGIFGFQNGGGPEWLGGRIEEVLRADLKRSLVFNVIDLPSVGVKVREVSGADKAVFKQAVDNGVSVLVWGKAGGKNGDKGNDLLMDGYVYDSGADEIVGGKRYVGSTSVVRLMAHRLGALPSALPVPYNRPFELGALTVELLPAGHILGSAQIRVIQENGDRVVYTGDVSLAPSKTAEAAQIAECDTLVIESTFGLPVYRWDRRPSELFADVNAWWRANKAAGKRSLVCTYALGKAQRVMAGVDAAIGPVYTHGAVEKVT